MNNNVINDSLKKFEDGKYATENELKEMDFYELAFYVQTLNKMEKIYSDIESLKEVPNGSSIES